MELDRAPVSAIQDGGRTDMEEDDGVTGAEVVINSPLNSISAFIAEINGDGDSALGSGGRGRSGEFNDGTMHGGQNCVLFSIVESELASFELRDKKRQDIDSKWAKRT
ncbi:hypothetical protein GH714_013333 [Hevea brasiliensis]|uniref:Uncharacterized protein n=1 Tax=Hevea brasiliensis TaxID=3981 RepID=A0A6A6KVR3_HEVBR|nr:hypothetical protein GH714_013333 [Hevea brasiliensis]